MALTERVERLERRESFIPYGMGFVLMALLFGVLFRSSSDRCKALGGKTITTLFEEACVRADAVIAIPPKK